MEHEVLKDLLTEETYAKVNEELQGKDVKLADLSKGEYVSKKKYDDAVADTGTYKAKAEAAESNYNALKSTTDAEKSTYEADLVDVLMQAELVKAKARDVDVILPLIDREKVTRNGKALEGLSEQLETLKKDKAYLFETEEPAAKKGKSGLDHGAGSEDADDAKIRKIMGLPQK